MTNSQSSPEEKVTKHKRIIRALQYLSTTNEKRQENER